MVSLRRRQGHQRDCREAIVDAYNQRQHWECGRLRCLLVHQAVVMLSVLVVVLGVDNIAGRSSCACQCGVAIEAVLRLCGTIRTDLLALGLLWL